MLVLLKFPLIPKTQNTQNMALDVAALSLAIIYGPSRIMLLYSILLFESYKLIYDKLIVNQPNNVLCVTYVCLYHKSILCLY